MIYSRGSSIDAFHPERLSNGSIKWSFSSRPVQLTLYKRYGVRLLVFNEAIEKRLGSYLRCDWSWTHGLHGIQYLWQQDYKK
jgi:hypothetical protein